MKLRRSFQIPYTNYHASLRHTKKKLDHLRASSKEYSGNLYAVRFECKHANWPGARHAPSECVENLLDAYRNNLFYARHYNHTITAAAAGGREAPPIPEVGEVSV